MGPRRDGRTQQEVKGRALWGAAREGVDVRAEAQGGASAVRFAMRATLSNEALVKASYSRHVHMPCVWGSVGTRSACRCLQGAAGNGKSQGQGSVGSQAWVVGAPAQYTWRVRAWRP